MTSDTRYLTDCQFFLRGSCSKGHQCPFRHSQDALQTTSLCEGWLTYTCFDVKCRYRHTSTDVPIVSTKDVATIEICKFFMHGRCSKGDACTFRHIVNEDIKKPTIEEDKPATCKRKASDILNRYSIRHKAAQLESREKKKDGLEDAEVVIDENKICKIDDGVMTPT